MGVQRIDADTTESTAGVVRLLRRAAEVASARSEAGGPGRIGGSLRWASIRQPTRHGAFCRTRSTSMGRCRSVRILLCCCGQRSSC